MTTNDVIEMYRTQSQQCKVVHDKITKVHKMDDTLKESQVTYKSVFTYLFFMFS